jgi:AcrR family transcriptional regulator
MSYPRGHRAEVRGKIIQSARRLFNRHGFDNVSLNQIMAGAGLTHGGFYAYFKSKSDLYSEVLGCFFTDPEWKNCWEGVEVDLASADVGPQVIRAYLSRQHFEDVENSCPMVALPTDVTRGGDSAKRAFETVFKAMVGVLERSLTEDGRPRRTVAQATAALCVGGMVVARAMVNRAVADDLRDACMAVALELGGWHKESKSKDRKSKRSAQLAGAKRDARDAAILDQNAERLNREAADVLEYQGPPLTKSL